MLIFDAQVTSTKFAIRQVVCPWNFNQVDYNFVFQEVDVGGRIEVAVVEQYNLGFTYYSSICQQAKKR